MKLKPKLEGQCILVPAEPVTARLGECNSAKLKVLLYILANPDFEPEDICEKLDITKRALNGAIEYWQSAGVFEKTVKKSSSSPSASVKAKTADNAAAGRQRAVMSAPQLPKYTSDEVADYVESHEGMHKLLNSCQQYMGKMFNSAETRTVVGLVDYLQLDAEYVMLLFSYCRRIDKRSVRYVEKLAVELFDNGITTYEELDSYLLIKEESRKLDKRLRGLFGIGSRSFTQKEKNIFENWVKWDLPFELIEKAYEITVENTGSASIPYCNAVLSSWYDKGYKSLREVEEGLESYRHDKENAKDKKGSFETDDYFEAALRRSYGEQSNKQ